MSDDLVAITPEVNASDLFKAYAQGLFPWSGKPARWFCPNPRAIFELERIRFPKRLLRLVRQNRFELSFDEAFEDVVRGCQNAHETCWIDDYIRGAFCEFHAMGYAHSVEVWLDGDLIGGLYGVQMARMYAGESMFSRVSNASKVAFYHLVQKLKEKNVELFDAQVLNPHTRSLGAIEIPRSQFLERLSKAVAPDYAPVSWRD